MSTENITAFLDKARTDEALKEKLLAINAGTETEASEAISRLAIEVGLPFTAEEFRASQGKDLSDADLEHVSGGGMAFGGWHVLESAGRKTKSFSSPVGNQRPPLPAGDLPRIDD